MIARRSFLLGIGAALAAPAVVRAESLMKLWVPKPRPLLLETALVQIRNDVLWKIAHPVFFVSVDGSFSVLDDTYQVRTLETVDNLLAEIRAV